MRPPPELTPLCATLQAKIAKLKKELLEPASGGGGGEGRGFDVHKVGDARVGFVGAAPPPRLPWTRSALR